jgi:hypothetical protein
MCRSIFLFCCPLTHQRLWDNSWPVTVRVSSLPAGTLDSHRGVDSPAAVPADKERLGLGPESVLKSHLTPGRGPDSPGGTPSQSGPGPSHSEVTLSRYQRVFSSPGPVQEFLICTGSLRPGLRLRVGRETAWRFRFHGILPGGI